ncbi:disulfide bond formation protein B [Natronomonas salsuginis]|uniref:Disulfide bond formation protein B n=1 Tax=Natronomonas salsuginis TaxID=2217661 RepID=A0A4V5ZNG6_9EURY|nr:disulfide bond formation protein B [Natronomonas salsuginis]TKR25223.1 disulfide bond formation protein B [Natronomonas salsuginis]
MTPAITDRSILAASTLVATVATAGSLYFSDVMGLVPCELCWFQRMGMYPLVVVLAVATYEDRIAAWRAALPLSVGGAVVAAYHSALQLRSGGTCSLGGGCGSVQYELFGILSIPNLSLLAFALISVGLAAGALRDR